VGSYFLDDFETFCRKIYFKVFFEFGNKDFFLLDVSFSASFSGRVKLRCTRTV